ncbi:flavin reductase family protein [Paracoccus sp. S-4012]|uniref:flavin reductase family protein n=1 Tax=Paracoccus sp. S-4012 TaxID=2665648 RepID=UPI001E37A1FB|nr:flavin reductase family protein [Paracoccus sp. S-4012]
MTRANPVQMPHDDLTTAFREAFRVHPAGVAIVTAETEAGPVALTISSLISVSAAPPIVAFSLSERTSTSQRVLNAETVVIHLARRADLPLAQLGATGGADRFGPGVEWERLSSGEPRYSAV